MEFSSEEDVIAYIRSLPPENTPEYRNLIIEAGSRGIAAISEHLPNDGNSQYMVVEPYREGVKSEAYITRQEVSPEDSDVQQYTYTRFNEGRPVEGVRFTPGEIPERWVAGDGGRNKGWATMQTPLAVENIADAITAGTPYDPGKYILVGNRLIRKRGLRGLAIRATRWLLEEDEKTE